ncbi:OX2R-like protein, partial [Mya arenaria]
MGTDQTEYMFVVGSAGNFLVCFSVWRSKSLRNATNYFLVNPAVSDSLVIVVCLPATIMLDALHSWFLGLAMCKVFIYMQQFTINKLRCHTILRFMEYTSMDKKYNA